VSLCVVGRNCNEKCIIWDWLYSNKCTSLGGGGSKWGEEWNVDISEFCPACYIFIIVDLFVYITYSMRLATLNV
jgi:hypothetical protein